MCEQPGAKVSWSWKCDLDAYMNGSCNTSRPIAKIRRNTAQKQSSALTMPRVQRTRCHLTELAGALVGAAAGEQDNRAHTPPLCGLANGTLLRPCYYAAGSEVTAYTVCEFSCSCCKSSTSLAADALCTYLLTDSTACEDFCCNANGLEALKVCFAVFCTM